MEIIKHSEIIETTYYHRFYEDKKCRGAGYCFDCDEHGNIDESKLIDIKKRSLERARNVDEYFDRGVQREDHHYREPAEGRCCCGEIVVLSSFTNECDKCGRLYNSAGQELAPRHQWGEETGEHWSDVSRIG